MTYAERWRLAQALRGAMGDTGEIGVERPPSYPSNPLSGAMPIGVYDLPENQPVIHYGIPAPRVAPANETFADTPAFGMGGSVALVLIAAVAAWIFK
jgi:hypothetical protein